MNECLTSPELSEFVQGKLEQARLDAIAAHLDQCGKCQDTVVALAEQSDTFVQGLRTSKDSSVGPFQNENALAAGLRRIVAVANRNHSDESVSASPEDIGSLESIGPYKIESRLGIGGMGAVYKAQHAKLKRTVALKMLPEDRWTNPDVIVRFEREMEAIGQLDHPHIVRASDAGEDNGLHYLVMEYVDGMDLARMVRRLGALPIPEACELIRQAAVGLEYAHEHGLIHRDIKPSNLMLGWQAKDGAKKSSPPTVKVLDMGLALLGDEHFQHEHELTTIGQLMGTLDYMSPEQGMDSHDVTATSDIFSLGATLFKLLTGKSPLDAMNVTTPLRKITTLATKDLPSIAEQRTDLPPELVQLVDRMLAREPQHRISSASEVASQLERFTKNADLAKLLRNAVQANSAEPVSVNQKRIGLPNSAESTRAVADGSGRRKYPWRIAAGFAGFFILAATVFRLSTDYGQLIVEADADDVTVEVRQGERVVDTIEVAAGQVSGETTIRSGKYELVLAGAGDELRLDANSVSIRRNDVETVRVTRIGSQEADHVAKTLVSNRTSPQQPTYDGRTYAEWLTELKTEKKAERMMDATKALLTLGSTDQSEEAAKAIIQIMRTHGSIVEDGSSQGKLIGLVREELQKMPADAFWAAVKEELQHGNHRSREFLGWFFLANSRLISEHSDEIANLLLQKLSEPQSHWALEKLTNLARLDTNLPKRNPLVLKAIIQGVESGAYDSPTATTHSYNAASYSTYYVQATETILENAATTLAGKQAEFALKALDSPQPQHRLMVIQAMEKVGPKAIFARDALLDLLKDEVEVGGNYQTQDTQNLGMGGMGGGGFGVSSSPDPRGRGRVFYSTYPDRRQAILDALAAVKLEMPQVERLFEIAVFASKRTPVKVYDLDQNFLKHLLVFFQGNSPATAFLEQRVKNHQDVKLALEILKQVQPDLAERLAVEFKIETSPNLDEPAANATPPSEKTYDSKTLSEWLQMIDTERNPELLVPAVKAIGMLADEKNGDEIAKRIFLLANQYWATGIQHMDSSMLNGEVAQKVWELPMPALVDQMLKSVDSPNVRMQAFLSSLTLPNHYGWFRRAEFMETLRSRETEFQQRLVALASETTSPSLRQFYLDTLINLHIYAEFKLPTDGTFLEALQANMSELASVETLYVLANVAPDTKGLAEELGGRLANSGANASAIFASLGGLGAKALPAASDVKSHLITIWKAPSDFRSSGQGIIEQSKAAIDCLGRMGPDAVRQLESLELGFDREFQVEIERAERVLKGETNVYTRESGYTPYDYFEELRSVQPTPMNGGMF